LPELKNRDWYLKVDTSNASPSDFYENGNELMLTESKSYPVKSYSLIILISK